MNNADPQERASEIEDLIKLNELNKATKRLMDFQKDFSQKKRYKREVIDIRATYTELSEEIRGIGKTEDTNIRTARLRQHILELVDSILEDYQVLEPQITSVEDTNLSQPEHFSVVNNFPIVQSPNKKEKNKTQYELAKENFRRNKGIFKPSTSSIVFLGENIDKRYRNSSIKFTLSNINISLKLGEITAVVGENGNGKTTLLRIIAGELATDSGKISYPGLTLNNQTDLYSIKQQIAYIPQQLPEWNGLLVNNLHFAASIHGITGQDNEDEVDFIINRLGLERYKEARWYEISGGYKMRFALAKAIIARPKLIILDEPLANLDINTQVLFLQDLRDLANSSNNPISVIISSQHLYEIESIADNIIFIKDGQAIYNDSVKNIGEDRTENSYEINCNLSKEQLLDLLENINYKTIEQAGNNFIIHVYRDVDNTDFLQIFVNNNVALKYFRDISKSTRNLFGKSS